MRPGQNKIFILILAAFMLGACSQSGAIEVGDRAPDFTLTDLNGQQVSLSSFSGKVVIVNFFASWCPPCRQEIPDFIELQDAYAGKGFSFIGVSLVNLQDTKSFAERMGINYPLLIDDGKVSGIYGPVRSIPTTFVIRKDLRVARVYIGARPRAVFEKDIQELLK